MGKNNADSQNTLYRQSNYFVINKIFIQNNRIFGLYYYFYLVNLNICTYQQRISTINLINNQLQDLLIKDIRTLKNIINQFFYQNEAYSIIYLGMKGTQEMAIQSIHMWEIYQEILDLMYPYYL
ncbi:unnamed protein product [Paramecium octaurelia]|uniref:Uncharacterized protein n=1 Tax=Paramecium octaurelia TaxID=43137 RepID=A0A8S1YRD8_PAROT|nr:unnamed protein product [Paramecium octaurelia]